MADKLPRIRKAPVTVKEKREKAAVQKQSSAKKSRLKAPLRIFRRPFIWLKKVLGKEYYLPMPNNKTGSFLNKRRSLMPRYFINSWRELKLVTWPGRLETWRLTFAVFVFAIIFGLAVTIVDKGLEQVFKKLIIE